MPGTFSDISFSAPVRVAKKILSEIVEPISIHDQVCWVSASIAVSVYPSDACEEEGLKRAASLLPETTAGVMDQVSPPAKISFLMTACTPQFPSTIWVMPKSTPIVGFHSPMHQVIL
jgi:hypothetical protein